MAPAVALAIALAAIFTALSLIHIFWAFGGEWGSQVSVPSMDDKEVFSPGIFMTLFVAALLAAAAVVCLARVQIVTLGPLYIWTTGVWVLAGVFTFRAVGDFHYVGFFKTVRDTEFARLDTLIFSPLCAGIALGTIILAIIAK